MTLFFSPSRRGPAPGRLVELLVVLASVCAACSSVEPGGGGPSEANPLDSEEGTLLYDLNQHRTNAGVSQVAGCRTLNVAASLHADDMRDQAYLNDTGVDGSTPRARACQAGYGGACDGSSVAMAELVASGLEEGHATLPQWIEKADTNAILVDPRFVVAGVGRSLGGDVPVWSLDLGGAEDPSCAP
jgi:uncharacterized protein YkwD